MSVTSVRLNQDIEQPLDQLARVLDRSKSYIINEALREYILKHSEEMQRWEETLEALDDVKNGRTVDGDEVLAWLRSWGQKDELEPPKV